MKQMRAPLSPLLRRRLSSVATCSVPPANPSTSLTQAELSQIHDLIPRLCDAGCINDAIHLIDAALLADPSPSSLPFPLLADRLSAHPDLVHTISLLSAFRHHPRCPSPLPVASLLLSSFFHRRRFKEAAQIFSWFCRSDSPCRPDREFYLIAINGFCGHGKPLVGLKAVREMVREGVVPGTEVKEAVRRALLQEARVVEAQELDAALELVGDGDDGLDRVSEVLDRMIEDWQE